MPRVRADPAMEDVAKTRRNDVTFSSHIMAPQLDISETFRITKNTSLDPTIQGEVSRESSKGGLSHVRQQVSRMTS